MISMTRWTSMPKRWLLPALGATTVTLAASAFLAPAQAVVPDAPAVDATTAVAAALSPEVRASHASVGAAVAAYWTPERMAAAVSIDEEPSARQAVARLLGSVAAPDGIAGTTPPAPSPVAVGGLTPGPDGVDVASSPTVGKVYVYDPSHEHGHECSGGAVNSVTKRLVFTAGHCVHSGGPGGYYLENFIFVPHTDDGSEPYGTFAARTFRTFDAWRDSSSEEHNIAMVTTSSNASGQRLVDAVGGNGLSWNYSKRIYLTVLTYPSQDPFDGESQLYCRGTTSAASGNRIELDCGGFAGSAGGGPWLRAYSDSTRVGYANGVLTTLASNGKNRSPYFDTKIKTMFDNTAGD